jgi:hypothetical protein
MVIFFCLKMSGLVMCPINAIVLLGGSGAAVGGLALGSKEGVEQVVCRQATGGDTGT